MKDIHFAIKHSELSCFRFGLVPICSKSSCDQLLLVRSNLATSTRTPCCPEASDDVGRALFDIVDVVGRDGTYIRV